MDGEAAARGLKLFTGSSRRFEKLGHMACGALVVDDYAHHPTEMRATLNSAKEMDFDRIICVFQSHTYTRTAALFDDFVDALKLCDKAILADIYAAREKNTIGISAADLAAKIDGAEYYPSFDEIEARVREIAQPNDLVIFMGAGTVDEIGYRVLA